MAHVQIHAGESIENALRRFKRKVLQEDIIKEAKKHSFYLKPGEKKRMEVRRSRWFGRTFGRAAHREWLNAFWKRYARLEWKLLLPHRWVWHVKAFSCATTEVVYAIRFSTVVLVQLLRQS